jgi:hypothetical protein
LKPAQANNSLDPISKEKKTNAKKCWWSVQEVEGLPSKSEALSSNPSTKKKIFFFWNDIRVAEKLQRED